MFFAWPFTMPNLFSFMSPTTVLSVSAPGWYYAPATEWGEGDQTIERRINKELATPGRQLGIMGDALAAIVDRLQHPEKGADKEAEEALGRLVALVRDAKQIVAEEEARKGSARLREIRPAQVRLPGRDA